MKIVIALLGRKRSKQAVANVNEMSSLPSFTLYLSPVLSESCHNVFFFFFSTSCCLMLDILVRFFVFFVFFVRF